MCYRPTEHPVVIRHNDMHERMNPSPRKQDSDYDGVDDSANIPDISWLKAHPMSEW